MFGIKLRKEISLAHPFPKFQISSTSLVFILAAMDSDLIPDEGIKSAELV